jgi:predicted RNA binding protein YcfA (HicA-like mRNA interferase family)
MPRKYPLKLREVLAILHSLGFEEKGSVGSHYKYTRIVKGIQREVTVDQSIDDFDAFLLKSMINQSGFSSPMSH